MKDSCLIKSTFDRVARKGIRCYIVCKICTVSPLFHYLFVLRFLIAFIIYSCFLIAALSLLLLRIYLRFIYIYIYPSIILRICYTSLAKATFTGECNTHSTELWSDGIHVTRNGIETPFRRSCVRVIVTRFIAHEWYIERYTYQII